MSPYVLLAKAHRNLHPSLKGHYSTFGIPAKTYNISAVSSREMGRKIEQNRLENYIVVSNLSQVVLNQRAALCVEDDEDLAFGNGLCRAPYPERSRQ